MFFLCLVALVKWPSLMKEALFELAKLGIDTLTATPSDWRAYVLTLCRLVDGRPMSDELKSISPGRTAAVFGLIWIATRWEILKKLPKGSLARAGVQVFTLGCTKQQYEVLPQEQGISKLTEAMTHVRISSLAFPGHVAASSHAAAWSQARVDRVLSIEAFANDVHDLCGNLCGQGSKLATGTLAGRLLSIAEITHGHGVWDDCSMSSFSDLLPDMKQNSTDIGQWSVRNVRKRFGMSPLMISAMACMWESVSAAKRQVALRAEYVCIVRAAEQARNPNAQPVDWACFL